ncbi:MAG: response regulator transcription factor [Chakrabartia sp.]
MARGRFALTRAAAPNLVLKMGTADANNCIHIVDDDAVVLESLQLLLRVHGRRTAIYGSASAFLEEARFSHQDIGLFDLHMPGLDGLTLMSRLRGRVPDARAILMTGYDTPGIAREAKAQGFQTVLHKPFHEADLLAALDGTTASER